MPPRFAYWTLLIDNRPTAFRAREQEELIPTLQQLRRTNKDVAMKWFTGGRLWDSPEQAAVQQGPKGARGPGGSGRRLGSRHQARGPTRKGPRRAVWHVALFTPRGDLNGTDREKLIEAFEKAVRSIPDVRRVRVGRRLTHGAGYETRVPPPADYVAVLEFDNLAGLQAYLQHPAHEELGIRFNQALSSSLIYDFEVGFEDLRNLARPERKVSRR